MLEKVFMGIADNNLIVWKKFRIDLRYLRFIFDSRYVMLFSP